MRMRLIPSVAPVAGTGMCWSQWYMRRHALAVLRVTVYCGYVTCRVSDVPGVTEAPARTEGRCRHRASQECLPSALSGRPYRRPWTPSDVVMERHNARLRSMCSAR